MNKLTLLAAAALLAGSAEFTGAASADPVNWEAVAQCESGGNWAADTGNGDYGGLQISQATWTANGGSGLPSQASQDQQIDVANRIMASQGPKAWPTCAARGDAAAAAPVGSLTHFMNALYQDAQELGTLNDALNGQSDN